MMSSIPVPQAMIQPTSYEDLCRQYGEAMIQFKIANERVMVLEQSFRQFFNQQPPVPNAPK